MNRCKNDKADETRMIRFIDPNYREMFQIPDGAYVEVKYPNSTVIVACRYMDEYHLRFGSEVYHICELAERLERCQATCAPEPEITEDECAWKLGNKGYLYVQVSEDGYDYQLYHSDFSEWDGGQVDTDGTMNEAKRMILEMYEMDTQTHERILTDELENSVEEKGETYE